MRKFSYCCVLIPVVLFFLISITFSQSNPTGKKLIEDRLNNSSLTTFLASQNANHQDFGNKDESHPLNPTQYLLRAGSWPYASSHSVAVDSINKIIYLGSGGAVLVLDGSDPANPILITDKIRTYGLVEDIFIDLSTKRLYLACGEGGYEIWNVADPADPFLYSRNEIYYYDAETPVRHVQVTGDFAIFECAWGYIHSVNVSDPYHPYQVSFSGIGGNPSHNIHIDEYGYIHTTNQQEYVVYYLDATGHLLVAGGFPIADCYAVFGGSQASYVGQGNYLWILYDGGYSTTNVGGSTHIEVRGNLAYIINNTGLHTWDVSDNANPYLLGSTGTEVYPIDLYVAGNYAYVSLHGLGLRIYDVSDPSAPTAVGNYNTYDGISDTYIEGNFAFITSGDDGLLSIDITDLNYPQLTGAISLPGYTTNVEIRDSIAYTCGIDGGLNIVNVSDPANPFLISSSGVFNGSGLEVGGNLAFVTEVFSTQSSFIRIFDVSDINNPVEINSMEFNQIVRGMRYRDGYLYVPAYDDGLFIYDLTNPLNPVLVSNIPHEKTSDVFLKGNVLYLTSATWPSLNGGLHLYDISDPSSPVHLGSYAADGFSPDRVEVKNEYAYTADGDQLWLFIIENNVPSFIEKYDLPDLASDIFSVDQYVFVSDIDAGLYIMENDLITNPFTYEWTIQQSGITANIWDIDMLNLDKGFASAEQGIILKTDDGGYNWQILQVGGYLDDFECINFGDDLTGWAGSETGKVFNTTDGGATWIQRTVPSTGVIREINFLDGLTGWIITLEDHYLLKTTDGGNTWINQDIGLSGYYKYFDMDIVDENTGYVTGAFTQSVPWNYFVIKTTDGGNNWSMIYETQDFYMSSIYFIDQNTGFLGGLFGELYKTTDGGNNWQLINDFGDIIVSDFCFTDYQRGWFVGLDGALYGSSDEGNSWMKNDLLIPNFLRAVDFVDTENGWIVGDGGIILRTGSETTPVELVSFTARTDNGKVLLEWTTATEKNNSGFAIERSDYSDPGTSNWKQIGFIEGSGTSAGQHKYSFTDNESISGIHFYRLKQIDLDGSFKYSDVVEVLVDIPLRFSLEQNYPNPFNPSTKINYSIPGKEKVTLIVYDILGNRVATLINKEQSPGNYEITFHGNELASGIYFYRLQAGSFSSTRKFVLLK